MLVTSGEPSDTIVVLFRVGTRLVFGAGALCFERLKRSNSRPEEPRSAPSIDAGVGGDAGDGARVNNGAGMGAELTRFEGAGGGRLNDSARRIAAGLLYVLAFAGTLLMNALSFEVPDGFGGGGGGGAFACPIPAAHRASCSVRTAARPLKLSPRAVGRVDGRSLSAVAVVARSSCCARILATSPPPAARPPPVWAVALFASASARALTSASFAARIRATMPPPPLTTEPMWPWSSLAPSCSLSAAALSRATMP
mmetsp:Transcript_63384/g.174396  ORF Transcript_63384/g.174396 Transcript_63384/m.174396 type:complete len:254 (-) Transcript_63384:481-1242(-)